MISSVLEFLRSLTDPERLIQLLSTLLAVLPHPAARQATARTATDRDRLFAGYRMPILRVVPRTRAPLS